DQGINTEHISKFLNRQLDGEPIPPTLAGMLEVWHGDASTDVTFETLQVMRTLSPEVMDGIYNEPAFRMYLGARLGEMACVIRSGHEAGLSEALKKAGISVEIR